MEKQIETAQLLARFKLQVKRTLGQSVDLERLSREPAYARQRLAEIEEAAEDEDLLVMLLRIRDLVVPLELAPPPPPPVVEAPPAPKRTQETRNYLLGARAW